ncbi:MAG: DUF222 domain-containing protein [Candidatus Nanopelagicales bacterium]
MQTAMVDRVVETRALGALPDASAQVRSVWSELVALSGGDAPEMGLAAGDRPGADVEVLCSAVAIAEYELARRMALVARSGSLPLVGDGAMLLARGWSAGWARRLARAGVFAHEYPKLGGVWAAGVITSEHVHAVARRAKVLTDEELSAVLDELAPLWGRLSPHAAVVFLDRVIRMLHPPADPDPDEVGAYESRSLSFALTSDSVVLAGTLPRLEGEAVIAAVDAFAERLRSQADHVPATARRADALVALVNAAHAAGSIPSRGGLPVSVSVTMDTMTTGEVLCTTSRGRALTPAEQRFSTCDALITPIQIDSGSGPDPVIDLRDTAGAAHAEHRPRVRVRCWAVRRWRCGPDRGAGSGSPRHPDPVGRRTDSRDCYPRTAPGIGHP